MVILTYSRIFYFVFWLTKRKYELLHQVVYLIWLNLFRILRYCPALLIVLGRWVSQNRFLQNQAVQPRYFLKILEPGCLCYLQNKKYSGQIINIVLPAIYSDIFFLFDGVYLLE